MKQQLRPFIATPLGLLGAGMIFFGCGDSSGTNPVPDGGVADAAILTYPDGGTALGASPMLAGCNLFPADNPWNRDVSRDAIRGDSAALLAAMAPSTKLHPDWGTFTENYGIPITTGSGASPVKISWSASWGATESDKVPCPVPLDGVFCYPIPSTAKIEGGSSAPSKSDRHVLYLDTSGAPNQCTLYELYNTQNWVGPGWTAANGAVFHLGSNTLRTLGWTSADAAGLPILPGLVRFDEIEAGEIHHALRFTLDQTQQAYIRPATHAAGNKDSSLPPMGLRVRLKSTVSIAGASAEATVLITAMKKYGLILADNGSNWYISGETHDGWSNVMDGILKAFGQLHGSDFEAVDTGPIEQTGL